MSVSPMIPPDATTSIPTQIVGRSGMRLFWERFSSSKPAVFGLVLVAFVLLAGVFAPVVAAATGHPPNALYENMIDDFGLPMGPNGEFLLGVDQAGRDLLVRILYGIRTSLTVAVLGTLVAIVVGTVVGLIAGYFRGWVDTMLSRGIDILLSLPLLMFAISLGTVCSASPEGCFGGLLKPGLGLVVAIVGLLSWPYVARVVRNEVGAIMAQPYFEAGVVAGNSHFRMLMHEAVPNLSGTIISLATLLIPTNVILEASLSFLGVGVPPDVPSLGRTIADSTAGSLYTYAWWLAVFPGLFLALITLAFNLFGDGLNEALSAKVKR